MESSWCSVNSVLNAYDMLNNIRVMQSVFKSLKKKKPLWVTLLRFSPWFPQYFWVPWSSSFWSAGEKAEVLATLLYYELPQLCQCLGLNNQETKIRKHPLFLESELYWTERKFHFPQSFGSCRIVCPGPGITNIGLLRGWGMREQRKWKKKNQVIFIFPLYG